jgi:5'-nucleotidase/UDP-sugar diphosphatase
MAIRRRGALAAGLAALGLCGWGVLAAAAPPEELRLTLLHTNDLHGHMVPFAYVESGRSPEEQPSVGGAARRATLVRKLRKEIRNPVMLVDGGDTFTRGPLTNAYEGIADVEAMNAVGYELAAVGNNEFKAKDAVEREDAIGAQAALLQVVKRARFPWVCANALDGRGAFLEGVQPYVVREWSGVRVGFLGLTAPRSAQYPQTRGWTISDPIEAAKTWIPRAREHCDVLIGLTHLGVELDKKLVAQTPGLDAVVGGDSHTFLYKAEEVSRPDGVRVPIVQDGEFGVNLGRFDLHFVRGAGGRWALADYRYALLPVGPGLREAPDVSAVLAPYLEPFRPVVGRIESPAPTSAARARQTTQILVDALRRETGADLALNPQGAVGQDTFHRSEVTRLDVYAAFPFKDRVVTVELEGAEVRRLVGTSPTFISGDLVGTRPDGRYRVALVEFVARDAYKLPDARLQATGRDLRELLIDYFRRGPVRTTP